MANVLKGHLFYHFLRDARTTGSVWPSSLSLTAKMVQYISPKKPSLIFEFGPGDGRMTRRILEMMHHDSRLVSFEVNRSLCDVLEEIDDARLTVVNLSAAHAPDYLQREKAALGREYADYVISGIPLRSIPPKDAWAVISAAHDVLNPQDGVFTQFQYSPFAMLPYSRQIVRRFNENFRNVARSHVWWNFLPAYVYACKIQSKKVE